LQLVKNALYFHASKLKSVKKVKSVPSFEIRKNREFFNKCVVSVLQPRQSGTHSHLAFATLPCTILIMIIKLTQWRCPGELPGGSTTLFDYFWDRESTRWVPWAEKVPEYIHAPDGKFHKILVPTVDTVRTTWLLSLQVGRIDARDIISVYSF